MARASEVMVVERDVLLGERSFQGFSPAAAYDYESIILRSSRYAPRRNVEQDPSFKQPIAYCVITNPSASLVFAYRRATGEGEYDEERLRGKWSIGIGGHIGLADSDASPDPIRASMQRELEEELFWEGPFRPRIIGYINDDVDMVGKVHFGLLYLTETDALKISPRTEEISVARMVSAREWGAMIASGNDAIEGWSLIATRVLLL